LAGDRPVRRVILTRIRRAVTPFFRIGRLRKLPVCIQTLNRGVQTIASLHQQSGRQWGRAVNFSLPVLGSNTVRVEPVTANRAPNVHIIDLRLDKSFNISDRWGRVTAMIDVFNLFNSNVPITFRTLTQNVTPSAATPFGNFKEVTAILDPRIVRFGVRYEF
jgi:hypothetical protein